MNPLIKELGLQENSSITTKINKLLNQEKITTIEQLIEKTRADLQRHPGFGKKCIQAIENSLAKKGLHLYTFIFPKPKPLHPLIEELGLTEFHGRRIISNFFQHSKITTIEQLIEMYDVDIQKFPNLGKTHITAIKNGLAKKGLSLKQFRKRCPYIYYDDTIYTLELSVRAFNVLKQHNLIDVRDIIKLSDKELLKLDNCGIKTVKDIRNAIKYIDKELNNE